MSTVIKADEAGRLLRRLSTVDLADHLAEARAVVDAARGSAAEITAEARARARDVSAEAQRAGYEAGYQRGQDEGTRTGRDAAYDDAIRRFEDRHTDVVHAMQSAIDQFEVLKEELMIAAREDVLGFAVRLAKKLTFAIGRLHRESAVENLERALRLVESKSNLTIHVHPDDVASMQTFCKTVLERADASRVVMVEADDSIAPGGCKVETDRTSVDATLETQVGEVLSLLLGENPRDA